MGAILSIARTTFRESIRNRTVLAIFLLAIVFIGSALLLANLSLDQRVRVIKDWGLFCVSAFGVALAILIGVTMVQKEIEKKTLYIILTRPFSRWQYVVGKYLGLSFSLLLTVGLLSLSLIALLAFDGTPPDHLLLKALAASLLEVMLVAALAVFFAAFSTPALSGFFTFGMFVVGRSLETLSYLRDKITQDLPRRLIQGLILALPDFADLNLATRAVHEIDITSQEMGFMVAYSIGYLGLLLFLSSWMFSRRDLV